MCVKSLRLSSINATGSVWAIQEVRADAELIYLKLNA